MSVELPHSDCWMARVFALAAQSRSFHLTNALLENVVLRFQRFFCVSPRRIWRLQDRRQSMSTLPIFYHCRWAPVFLPFQSTPIGFLRHAVKVLCLELFAFEKNWKGNRHKFTD